MGTVLHLSIDTEEFLNLRESDYFRFMKTLKDLCQSEQDIDYEFINRRWCEFEEGAEPEWLAKLYENSRVHSYHLVHDFPGVVKVRWIKNDFGNVVSGSYHDIKDDKNGGPNNGESSVPSN